MFTASVLALVFLGLVIPVLMGIMSLALRVFGWTVRAMFSIIGILLLPVGLVVMAVVGVVGLAYVFAPFLLLWLVFSAFATES
ncbi:MAG: hypothetical protein IJM67_10500 [Atopobiaceae bacterium]|nr:hypothetical protein [Atopobiaceae bacterium]MBQ3283753.1 hypothetical protein [Atopobiaceae bacterium]MBQ6651667.1 hypothetical protein [Atopobiaceae bacterium]